MEKKFLLTATFISVLLLLAFEGTQVPDLIFAQSPEIITIEADGSINPSTAPKATTGGITMAPTQKATA